MFRWIGVTVQLPVRIALVRCCNVGSLTVAVLTSSRYIALGVACCATKHIYICLLSWSTGLMVDLLWDLNSPRDKASLCELRRDRAS